MPCYYFSEEIDIFLSRIAFINKKEFCEYKMEKNRHTIYVTQGEFFASAIFMGSGQIELRDAIEKYRTQGKYNIKFDPIKKVNSRLRTLGTFDQPAPGSMVVEYDSSNSEYWLSGESFGDQTIADVVKDCAEHMQLSILPNPNEAILDEINSAIFEIEPLLWWCESSQRRVAYLGLRERSRN